MGMFSGKVVVVTGAASGFGEATARRFAGEGADVVVADVNSDRAKEVAASMVANGQSALAVGVDVRMSDEVADMIAAAESAFGGIDVLVNNAGLIRGSGPIEEMAEEDFDLTMSVNVKGTFLGVKHGVPALRRRGGGVILNTASVSALVPRRRSAIYAASKGAVVTMTRALAVDLAPAIRVNCVCPVAAVTRFQEGVSTDPAEVSARLAKTRAAGASIPMKRIARVEDVADAFIYLASPGAGFLTGVVLPVDGGRSAGDPS